MRKFPPGVIHGKSLTNLFDDASTNHYALPAVNVFNTNSINAVLETAAAVNSPVCIQFSVAGAQFFAGMGLPLKGTDALVLGAVSGALHIHTLAAHYGVTVVLHTDHTQREWLPWIDGLLKKGEEFKNEKGVPLFSSHMLDLSSESLQENLTLSANYLKRLDALGMGLELELGMTGGEEGHIDNTQLSVQSHYTHPKDILLAYECLQPLSSNFLVAASFGNIHGLYNPNNVELRPEILEHGQSLIQQKHNTAPNPIRFVFHGGSGCDAQQISKSLKFGVVKMNIDTDLHWSFWNGVRQYYHKNESYLKSPLGNPEGSDKPNKKFYDAKTWLREGEKHYSQRLIQAFQDLNCVGRNR
jgi:fructose-bisphosphate aldolase class II